MLKYWDQKGVWGDIRGEPGLRKEVYFFWVEEKHLQIAENMSQGTMTIQALGRLVHVSDAESRGLVYNPLPPNRTVASLIQWNNRPVGLTAISQCCHLPGPSRIHWHCMWLHWALLIRGHHPHQLCYKATLSVLKKQSSGGELTTLLYRQHLSMFQEAWSGIFGSSLFKWMYWVWFLFQEVCVLPNQEPTPQAKGFLLVLVGPPTPKTARFEVLSPYLRVFGWLWFIRWERWEERSSLLRKVPSSE